MEDQIINLYKSGYSQYAIAKQFGVSYGKIRSILLRHKVPIRQGNQNKKYSCDDNYFSVIDSHEKAYWLGFITADGSVSKKENGISIGLSYRDVTHLEKFKSTIQSDGKIFIYNSTVNGKIHLCCKHSVYSAAMKNDLAKHNVVPNKSKTLQLSQIVPVNFENSYLLGIIDGDGSFYMDKKGQMHFNLIGSKSEIENIQSILIKNCNINKNTIRQEPRSKEMYYLNYGGNGVLDKIVNYLYHSSPVYLERKFNRIKHLLITSPERKRGQP